MTNQKAIEELKARKEHYEMGDGCEVLVEALEKGIEALENQETVIEKLEKMKAKIQELAHYDRDYGFVLPEMEVSDMIYAYIHELKGE